MPSDIFDRMFSGAGRDFSWYDGMTPFQRHKERGGKGPRKYQTHPVGCKPVNWLNMIKLGWSIVTWRVYIVTQPQLAGREP